MSEKQIKVQTRGRPKKNMQSTSLKRSKRFFSEHSAVFYSACMVYVLQIFLKTKEEKRIGHSQGGFTLYQKIDNSYSFFTLEEDLQVWGFSEIIGRSAQLLQFIKTTKGCAPKIVFKQIVNLFVVIHLFLESNKIQTVQQLQLGQDQLIDLTEGKLKNNFKYIRFSEVAIRQLKLQKWWHQVNQKIDPLWRSFLKIIIHTIYCVENNIETNKYFKPFFSDAQNPEETIIGQLNLQQIVTLTNQRQNNKNFVKIQNDPKQMPFQNEQILMLRKRSSALIAGLQNSGLTNKRAITLITIPSFTQIDQSDSPRKKSFVPFRSRRQQNQQLDVKEQAAQGDGWPLKKVKIE